MFKKTICLALTAVFAFSCNLSKKAKDDLVVVPETEYRYLDTLTITAPKPDQMKTAEEFELPRYNPSHTRVNDLLHTKLEVRFDWSKEQVLGKATLKLKPHFYETRILTLDAKNFEFHKITFAGSNQELKYEYDGQNIVIDLGRAYKRDEEYTLLIDYTASPNESGGSAAITSDKGLFFINPTGEDTEKPQQIWTQGETENNSRWFPTIDKPNERCTQEMYITVQDKYKTLSNGDLVKSTPNSDGTRTDYWNMTQPHAPYLFMIAVGEFAVITDEWKGKKIEYFVEKEYEEHARRIFPHTPEMLSFFSDILGVEYPWQKYSQVIVRDFVSGAMENTTGVIFGEFIQGTERELIDDLTNDKIVAHEMFHHWFGDLVTCESWANLTMNEGFANYSEYLWLEHKYGKDEADFHLLNELQGYLSSTRQGIHPLIHFGHLDKEDMFDSHSYNKGGLVLHQLRNYLGDDAFFAGLKKYLTDNQYSDVEAHELRLAYEDVTGEDLNWFFNQWYFEAGHPELKVEYAYDETAQKVTVTVEQLQDPTKQPAIFQMPVAIDVYTATGEKVRHEVVVNDRIEKFEFDAVARPKLVNFDADRIILGEIEDNKTEEELIFQYENAPLFKDRYEAIESLKLSENVALQPIFENALSDDFWVIRAVALGAVEVNAGTENIIATMAEKDKHSTVRRNALSVLANTNDEKFAPIAKNALNDPSYEVIGTAMEALVNLDKTAALGAAKDLETSDNPQILTSIGEIYAASGDTKYLSFFESNWDKMGGFSAISFLENYAKVAAEGDARTLLNSATKLEKIAVDMQTSPWRRFAAMNGINSFHGKLATELENEKDEAKIAALKNTDTAIVELIESIKKTEENDRLKAMYLRFPAPEVKP
jgi:aminopeptidase N